MRALEEWASGKKPNRFPRQVIPILNGWLVLQGAAEDSMYFLTQKEATDFVVRQEVTRLEARLRALGVKGPIVDWREVP